MSIFEKKLGQSNMESLMFRGYYIVARYKFQDHGHMVNNVGTYGKVLCHLKYSCDIAKL